MGIPTMVRSLVRKGLFVLIGAVVLVALTIPVQATLITYNFSGTVNGVDASLSPQFLIGQTLSGSYTFDSAIIATGGSTNASAVYDALTAVSLSIGPYNGSSNSTAEIQVTSGSNGGSPWDVYALVSSVINGLTPLSVNGNDLLFFGFRLDDTTNSQFTAGALTLPTSLSLSNFTSNGFFLDFGDPAAPFVVSGTLTGLSQTASVPEPATMLLLGSGLIGLVGFRRKFKK